MNQAQINDVVNGQAQNIADDLAGAILAVENAVEVVQALGDRYRRAANKVRVDAPVHCQAWRNRGAEVTAYANILEGFRRQFQRVAVDLELNYSVSVEEHKELLAA